MKPSFNKEDFLTQVFEKLGLQMNPIVSDGLVLFFENTYKVQIEFVDEAILVSSVIGELLVSRFREKVFEDALKSNFKDASCGALGYSDQQKNLILVLSYPCASPKADEFALILDGFIKKAKAWNEALKNGNTRLLV